jgi:hypothetical protein
MDFWFSFFGAVMSGVYLTIMMDVSAMTAMMYMNAVK